MYTGTIEEGEQVLAPIRQFGSAVLKDPVPA